MEHDTRRVRRREYDGTWTVLCDSYEGKKLNAPNDAASGTKRNRLFMCGSTSIYAIYVNAVGAALG
jgi:hypothetical protein